jgi:hypothetical protein
MTSADHFLYDETLELQPKVVPIVDKNRLCLYCLTHCSMGELVSFSEVLTLYFNSFKKLHWLYLT